MAFVQIQHCAATLEQRVYNKAGAACWLHTLEVEMVSLGLQMQSLEMCAVVLCSLPTRR